jgi:hypothetical protein
MQSALSTQPDPSLQGAHPPPQSRAVSVPFFTPSEHVGARQMLSVPQTPLKQSLTAKHFAPATQGAQMPPQSRSVSEPF